MKNQVKEALQTLRDQGIHIPRKLLSRAMKEQPPIHHADLRKFRAYCELAWKQKTRFVVGWGGAAGSKVHLTFHTAEGFAGRTKHASTIQAKARAARETAPASPKKRKEGHPVSDVRQQTLPMPTAGV